VPLEGGGVSPLGGSGLQAVSGAAGTTASGNQQVSLDDTTQVYVLLCLW